MKRTALIGTGFMGSAIGRALREAFPDIEIGVVDSVPLKREEALSTFADKDFGTESGRAMAWADLTILAVKPQDLSAITAPSGTAILSVLAGTSIARISSTVGSDRVARIMPSLAADIRRSVVGLSFATAADDELVASSRSVARAMGTVLEVKEDLLHAVTAVSGSGIAFVFDLIHAMALGGVREGLRYDQALQGVTEVFGSAAALLQKTGVSPTEMVTRVCSPAGTTIAGIEALERTGVRAGIMEAIHATAMRSRALES